jgi:N-acyl-D-amino-acid deacylase
MAEVDFLIYGGQVVDGTGSPQRRADVAVSGDRIAAVERDLDTLSARERIDATGCLVTPGIVDIHSHADWTITVDGDAESAVLQGISTIVPGQCGHGVAPVADPAHLRICAFGLDRDTDAEVPWRTFGAWLEHLRDRGTAVNVVPLVAHGAIRLATMGTSTTSRSKPCASMWRKP